MRFPTTFDIVLWLAKAFHYVAQTPKRIKDRCNIIFRNHYERRVSLPWGITRFISNVAFIQLTHEEFIDLAPVPRFASAWVTTTGMRPLLNYAVYLEAEAKWQHVQVIIEIDRGFQIHNETPESEKDREAVLDAIALGRYQGTDKPRPAVLMPKFLADDWELTTIEDPRLEPLKDVFLGFAFYAPFTVGMKRKIEVPSGQV